MIKEPVDYSPKVDNILQKLKELPTEGTLLTSKNYSGFYDPTVNHIQGHSVYTNHNGIIFDIYTHSVKSADYAHIFVSNRTTGQTIGFNTFGLNQRHPGGINIIGDYLVVPTEDNNKSTIAMYDLRSLDVGELRRVEDFQLNLSHKAGSLALIDYHQDGKDYYLMMVAHLDGKNSVYHVYRAEKQNNIETAKFEKVSELPFSKDFQGFGLVKDRNNQNIYFIGLYSENNFLTFKDMIYTYTLNTKDWTFGNLVFSKHVKSHGGDLGVLGVHYRYGAGVYINPNGELIISATERNVSLDRKLATNQWTN